MLARTDPGTIASLGISYSHATGRMRHHKFGTRLADQTLSAAQEVDAVSGCVMLLTRQVLQAIGELDERISSASRTWTSASVRGVQDSRR
jgi:hypothetical protein